MNGCTIPYAPIAVDFWKIRQCPRVKFFFLSHAYIDQTCGLTHSWSMPIYCSPVTKKILLSKFPIKPEIVHELELNTKHVISLSDEEEGQVTVMLLDANYCPGSVMFIFEGYFGKVVYTGNFRFHEPMLAQSPLDQVLETPVDVLYLDTTYCGSKCRFPNKSMSLKEIIDIIEKNQHKKVLIALETLGKEELLISLSNHFKEKIKVGEDRLRVLKTIEEDHNFTSSNDNDDNIKIEVVPFDEIVYNTRSDWNVEGSAICLIPTGLFSALGYHPFENRSDVYVIPYSSHSCYNELMQFVSKVHPRLIVPMNKPVTDPMTGALMDKVNIECFQEFLEKSPMHNYHIPQSIIKIMNQNSNQKTRRKRISRDMSKKSERKGSTALNRQISECENSAKTDNVGFEQVTSKSFQIQNAAHGSTHSCDPSRRISLPTRSPRFNYVKKSRSFDSLFTCPGSFNLTKCPQAISPDLKKLAESMTPDMGLHPSSNLVRCHRARLCDPSQCQTVCHSKNALDDFKCSCQYPSIRNSSLFSKEQKKVDSLHASFNTSYTTASSYATTRLHPATLTPSIMYSKANENLITLQNVSRNKDLSRRSSCLLPINEFDSKSAQHDLEVQNRKRKYSAFSFVGNLNPCAMEMKKEHVEIYKLPRHHIDEIELESSCVNEKLQSIVDIPKCSKSGLPPKKKWNNEFQLSQQTDLNSLENRVVSKPVAPAQRKKGVCHSEIDASLLRETLMANLGMFNPSTLSQYHGSQKCFVSSTFPSISSATGCYTYNERPTSNESLSFFSSAMINNCYGVPPMSPPLDLSIPRC